MSRNIDFGCRFAAIVLIKKTIIYRVIYRVRLYILYKEPIILRNEKNQCPA